jgi:hypothetical protein
MSAISNIYQIVTLGAGSATNMVLFEIHTSDAEKKRIIVARKSIYDPSVYFLDHEALAALGIFTESGISHYEDTWPADLTPALTTEGALPIALNSQFANADFGIGKVGTFTHNGYDYVLASFMPQTNTAATAATVSYAAPIGVAASTEVPAVELNWYEKPNVKTTGIIALALGVLTLIVKSFSKKK